MAKNDEGNASAAITNESKSGELKATALAIYCEMIRRGNPDGYMMEETARKSFQRAKAFLDVCAKVESGALSIVPPCEPPVESRDVHQWDLSSSANGSDQWVPLYDEKTGKPVMREELVDHFSFASNLSPEHPINKRSGLKLMVDRSTGKTVVAP